MVKVTKPQSDISGKEHHANEALQEEIDAAIRQKAEGWERTFKALAEQAAKDGRCTCEEKQGAGASELQHDNFDCPVAIYLKMGRLVIEDLEKD